jgi:hypothetical protein
MTTKDFVLSLLRDEKNSLISAISHAQFNLGLKPEHRLAPIEDEDQLRIHVIAWQKDLDKVNDALYLISKVDL